MKSLNQNEIKLVSGAMKSNEVTCLLGLGAFAGILQSGYEAIGQTTGLGYLATAGQVADQMVVGAFVGAFSVTLLAMFMENSGCYIAATHDSNLEHFHIV